MTDETKIQLVTDGVVLENLTVPSRDAWKFLNESPQDEWASRIVRAIEIGVWALQRALDSGSMDFVKNQAKEILGEVEGKLQALPESVESGLRGQMGTDEGQLLRPVRDLIEKAKTDAETVIRDVKTDVENLYKEHLDPGREGSTIAKKIRTIEQLLTPGPGSVPDKVEEAIATVTSADGTLAQTVKALVTDALQPYRDDLSNIVKVITEHDAITSIVERTTLKGHSFQERVYQELLRAFGQSGCVVENIGGDNKTGDILLSFTEGDREHKFAYKIIVEAKDETGKNKGVTALNDILAKAMDRRDAAAAAFIAPPEAFTNETRYWHQGHVDQGPWVSTTPENAVEAVRFLRIKLHLGRGGGTDEVDMEAAEKNLRVIHDTLRKKQAVLTQLDHITSAASSAEDLIEDIHKSIDGAAKSLEVALGLARD